MATIPLTRNLVRKWAWLICFIASTGLGGLNLIAGPATVVVGKPAQGAALPSALLGAYAGGARDITIAPGTYHIPPTGKAAIELNGWSNAVVHARRVTIIFEELGKTPVYLRHCEDVTLEDATLRFAEPSFTQGRITAIGQDGHGKYFDWQIDTGYPVFDPAKSFFDVADQHTRLLKPGTGDVGCASAESRGAGLFRLRHINGLTGSAAVGDWLFTRRPDGGSSIIHLDGCSHCTMRGITLENAGFGAFFETDGEGGHHYVDCRVRPGPKPPGATEEELVGCGADGFHSVNTRNGPIIERCAWEGLLHDDCIAIHGSLQAVVRASGKTLVLEKGNRGGFAAGEPVRISSTNGFFGEFTCASMHVLKDGGNLLELTLDRAADAPAGAKASNPQRDGAGYVIRDCKLGNTRSRGILVKGDNGLIEDCTITGCGMSAISIGPEYYWREADYSRHVTVRHNTLRKNVLNGSGTGVVFVHGDGAMGNTDITIADNFFDRTYGHNDVYVEDTDGVLIADNRFVAAAPLPDGRTVLDFRSARNITLEKNVVEHASKSDRLVRLGKDVEGIKGNDAAGIGTE